MENSKKSKYFLGLDIGTNSVGFCVTDENYNVVRKSKKSLIGTRLFEDGDTAVERRVSRANRRRGQRKKERIALLQSIFAEEINKNDENFFMRLKESMYHAEDKTINQTNTLFNDATYKDSDFHSKYKTVYHLRKDLMLGEVTDPRLLYLGIEHIIKSRGHFLFYGEDMGSISDFRNIYKSINEILTDDYDYLNPKLDDSIDDLEKIIKNKDINATNKEKEFYSLIKGKPSKGQKEFIKLLLGSSCNLTNLFTEERLDEELVSSKKKLTLKGDFDTAYAELSPKLDDDMKLIIELAKAIYDYALLSDILSCEGVENPTISDAQIYKYNTHKEELKLLKDMVRQYNKNAYQEIFNKTDVKDNYVSYIGMTKKNGNKKVVEKSVCSQEDFCKFVLAKFKDCDITDLKHLEIITKLNDKKLLPKQRASDNGVIPNQVHLAELKIILDVNKDKFPFLLEITSDDITNDNISNLDKIASIFKYRIPYYVGPLNSHSQYSWIVKKQENQKIYPWNFNDIVNIEESAEAFIRRMTNKCTYLGDIGKDVIPQKSLLYSKYMVLNELNNLKIDGTPITVGLKQELYNDLFLKEKKVSQHKLKKFLKKQCHIDNIKTVVISGIDGDFKASLETEIIFRDILGGNFDADMVEDIIKWIVLFSDDKDLLGNKIKTNYNSLSDKEIKLIRNLKFAGWGSFSKEFLTDIHSVNKDTGETLNIIDMLYNTNLNLMQVLSNEYSYMAEIKDMTKGVDYSKITLDTVKDLYCSPAVKKSIWQTVKIVKEIEKIMKCHPEKLFVEVTRAEGEKKATTSRKRDLITKYNYIKKQYADLYNQLDGKSESDLRQKKLYLYFTQLGRCAYTNEVIDLSNLNNHNIYDIEHIYPRSLTKDDSIHNNLVLVRKDVNASKSNNYPIESKYRQDALWALLYDKNLITKEKYDRLNRKTPFEKGELSGFIARQLVETSQASKSVATLFSQYYQDKDAKVVYVKAGNVSDFRKHFDIVKVRDVNDYHHAHDAYLNIVVGNVWDTRFTTNFFKRIDKNNYSLNAKILYDHTSKGNVETAWNENSISTVKSTIANSKILFTRQSFKATGALFDQTIYKKTNEKTDGKLPTKMPADSDEQMHKLTDLTKYGSYKSIKGSHFCVVEHLDKKGETVRTIEYIPIYLTILNDYDDDKVLDYLINDKNLQKPRIILKELKIGSLLNVDGMPMHVSGRTGDRIIFKGAVQLILNQENMRYYKKLSNFFARQKEVNDYKIVEITGINKDKNLELYDFFVDKLSNSIYGIHLKAQEKTLVEKRDKFIELTLEKQSILLVNLLVMFKCNASECDLTLIGGSGRVGTLTISKNITKRKSVKLIYQSITGYYTEEIDLLK